MTNKEAYTLACQRFGHTAAVWAAGPSRFVVGWWIRCIEAKPDAPMILRGTVHGLLVRGEGVTWEAAFRAVGK